MQYISQHMEDKKWDCLYKYGDVYDWLYVRS